MKNNNDIFEISSDSELNNDEHKLASVDKEPQMGFSLPAVLVPKQEVNADDAISVDDALGAVDSINTDNATAASATPSLTITGTTATSITVSAVFPASGARGNCIGLIDFNNGNTIENFPYDGNWYKGNGTYTISSLTPGGFYVVGLWWSTNGGSWSGGENAIYRRVQLPYNTTESLVRNDGSYVFTNIEAADKANASSSNFSTWINRLDSSYLALKELTGRVPYSGNKIELKSSRQDFNVYSPPDGKNYWYATWGLAGNPALLSRPFVRSHMLRLASNDWGDCAIHEMSHDFDNYAWEFDSEFFADFKEYYVVENLNATVYRPDTKKYYTGANFYNFFNADQMYSYSYTFNYGYYHSRGMTALFIRIKNTIGWQAFKNTFSYFNNLTTNQVPINTIGKFNLFISKLRDYANRDVIGLLTANEKNIIQTAFGGTIGYIVKATPTINDGNSSPSPIVSNQYRPSFTRYPGKFIHCNYPERLPAAALGDSNITGANKFLNQAEVNGDAQLFASHYNNTGYNISFGVQLFNPGTSPVTVKKYNNGHHYTSEANQYDYCDVNVGVWKRYFSTLSQVTGTYTIKPGGSEWIHEGFCPSGQYFNSVVNFNTSGKVWCYAYVYTSRTKLTGNAGCYPWTIDQEQYRGYGDSFFIESSPINLYTNNMPYKIVTGECGNNTGEMTTITDYCANYTHSCSTRPKHLGNWFTQYLMNVNITNNSGVAKTIKAYIGDRSSDPKHTCHALINYNGTIKGCCQKLNSYQWNWLTDTIPAGYTHQYQYQFIPIANTVAALQHVWTAV